MQPGQMFGPFKILSPLGQGAMGVVYLAEYTKNGAKVALKLIAPHLVVSNPQGLARFEREAQILKQLNHPNIVQIYGHGRTGGTPYYAMELLSGESMDKILSRREKLSWQEVIDFGIPLSLALQHAHERGIIHRDLKPANLILGNDNVLKLADFGIAKDLEGTQLTSAHCAVGTAAYMSPEQCRAQKDIDNRSDLYSMGIVFYEWITGQKPFRSENSVEMFRHHLESKAPRPSRLVPEIPVWLDSLVVQLLEKKRELRPRDASAVADALQRIREKVTSNHSAALEASSSAKKMKKATPQEKELARLVRKKGKVAKLPTGPPLHQTGWFVSLAGVLLVGVLGMSFWLAFLKPPSPESLLEKATLLVNEGSSESINAASEGPIATWTRYYSGYTDPVSEQVAALKKRIRRAEGEERLERYLRRLDKKFQMVPANPEEETAFAAVKKEADGEPEIALPQWRALAQKEGGPWRDIAASHIAMIEAQETLRKAHEQMYSSVFLGKTPPALEGNWLLAYDAFRLQALGDEPGAWLKYTKLRDQIGIYPYQGRLPDPDKPEEDMLGLWILANKALAKPKPEGTSDTLAKARNQKISVSVEMALSPNASPNQMRLCIPIVEVYRNFPEARVEMDLLEKAELVVKRLNFQ